MDHERLKRIKENLLCCVEDQMCHIEDADTNEMMSAIDMIKDLEEAIYYSTITKAMIHNEPKEEMKYHDRFRDNHWSVSGHDDYHMDSGEPMGMRDEKEGRSPQSRRMYMDAKMNQMDKTVQLRELEKYMQELSQDIIDMIQDASPEEKQYLEKKMTTLATKIGQMK
jgi:hypothetical protein